MDKKVGIIGDIHCQDAKLAKIITYLKFNADKIVAVGDVVDGYGDCSNCIHMLKENGIMNVLGNHEKWLLNNELRNLKGATLKSSLRDQEIEYIKSLEEEIEFEFAGQRILLCHGISKNDMATVKPGDYGYGLEFNTDLWKVIGKKRYDIMIGGHSHQEMARKIANLVIINPGALENEDSANFGIINFDKREVKFFGVKDEEIIEIKIMGIPKSWQSLQSDAGGQAALAG